MSDLLNRQAAVTTAIRRVNNNIMADDYAGDLFVVAQDFNTLQMHFDRFVTVHDALVSAAQATELDAHITMFQNVETWYNEAMVKLRRMQTPPEEEEEEVQSVRSQMGGLNLKLERLSVPKFDGTLQNWLAFKDAFETLVHSQDFPEAYKLGKLREAVKGDAVALVGGMYSGGYNDVWQTLTDRYDSPKQLAEIHVSRFIGIKPQSNETTSGLLSVVDTVREAFRALTVMELPVDQWDALAVPIITSKLPQITQQAWNMSRTTNEIPTLKDLLSFVEKRAHSLTADVLRWPAAASATQQGAQKGATAPKQSPRLVKSNLTTTTPGSCAFCNKPNHQIGRCSQLAELPVADRFSKLRGTNLCFNCLQPGHATRQCGSVSNCRTCGGRHHTLLCRKSGDQPATAATPGAALAPPPTTQTHTPASPANLASPPTNWLPQQRHA